MKELSLSKSSIEKFCQCQLAFSYRYIQKVRGIQAKEDKKAALFGVLIHRVLEKYFTGNNTHSILDIYKDEYKKEDELDDLHFYQLGERLITDYAKDLDSGHEILALEQEFSFTLSNGVNVKGIIDRVEKISDEEIEIVDMKTGYSQPLTKYELDEDIQVGIYDLAVSEFLYPQFKKFKLTLNYLHYDPVSTYRTPQQRETLKNYLGIIYERIQKVIESGEEPKPTINSYCSFCDYKSICPAFQSLLKQEDNGLIISEYEGLIRPDKGLVVPLERIDEFLNKIRGQVKILGKLEEDVEKFILEYIKKNGSNKVKLGKTNFWAKSSQYENYSIELLIELAKEHGLDLTTVLSPRKTEVDKIFRKNKNVMNKLKQAAQTSYSKERLKSDGSD